MSDQGQPSTSKGSVRTPQPETEHAAVVDVDVMDVRLPCRGFDIRFKVSDSERFSLTAEFLLRLLHATGSMTEPAIADFFGFSADEVRYVIEAAERQGHITRASRLVSLTDAGSALFDRGEGTPTLYDIQSRHGRFDFDLISFAPADYEALAGLDYELPELEIRNVTVAGNARDEVTTSFKQHFRDLRNRKPGGKTASETLYTVDQVEPGKRFSAVVPVSITVRKEDGAHAEANLLGWKTGIELERRSEVTAACASLVADIRVPNGYGQEGAARMAACAPSVIGRFLRQGGALDAQAFFELTAPRSLVVDLEATTERIVGSFWTGGNLERIGAAILQAKYRYPSQKQPDGGTIDGGGMQAPLLVWMKPNRPWWGATRQLGSLVTSITGQFSVADEDGEPVGLDSILVESGAPSGKEMRKAFQAAIRLEGKAPQGLEVLLVTSRIAAVAVHVPLSPTGGYPLPLGFISHDPLVVERVHRMLVDVMSHTTQKIVHQALDGDLWGKLDSALVYAAPPSKADMMAG